ncbi:hypothetical protein E0Z10_g2245 [Xylaria hypoxylon]|uniref:Uncharacterized protein n=1 Tax=Xylaria hypoxylon TaxID=37992 RepID=A0A4Z0Z486_9PEZI|nr:hypothetical protein E0Z10_g2245 [Xylaria hypoxylon]
MITLAPIRVAHVDQTPAAAVDRATELLKKRFRIINVWRPFGSPVELFPLVLCDRSSVPREQLVEVNVVRQSFPGESYYPLESKVYKWHFLNKQSPDEVLLIKMNSSDTNVKAHYCPHALFSQTDDTNAKDRESIEVRALVFTD